MDRIVDRVQSRRRGADSKNRIETDLATERTVAQEVGPRYPVTQLLQSSELTPNASFSQLCRRSAESPPRCYEYYRGARCVGHFEPRSRKEG
jgi:hypothetical protein